MKDSNTYLLVRKRIITGFLIVAPLGVTIFVLKWLFTFLANILAPVVKLLIGESSPFLQSVFSILILLCLLYLIGLLGSNIVGRLMIGKIESIVIRIPIISAVYSSIQQVIHTFSQKPEASFERVVWVKYPTDHALAIGFVTGEVKGDDGTNALKIFVPTAPNPTSGFLVFMKPDAVSESGMSVEQAIQMIISGGIVSPETINVPVSRLEP